MEKPLYSVVNILETVKQLATTSLELQKLYLREKAVSILSKLIKLVISLSLIFFLLLFLNIGIAIWIGRLIQNGYMGFFIVAGFYGLGIFIYLFLFQKWINRAVIKILTK
jgi:uncharacterized membrane protein YqjE